MKYLKIILGLFIFIGVSHAYECLDNNYLINNACINELCYETNQVYYTGSINELPLIKKKVRGEKFYITTNKFTYHYNLNFSKWFDYSKNNLEKKLRSKYTIRNFCGDVKIGNWFYGYREEYKCPYNARFSIKELFEYKKPFTIDDSIVEGKDTKYISGEHYFFENQEKIIDKLDYYNTYKSIDYFIPNYISYEYKLDKNSEPYGDISIKFKNVCDNSDCLESHIKTIDSTDKGNYKFLRGKIGELDVKKFNKPNFDVDSNIDYTDLEFFAGQSTTVSFPFSDILPENGCLNEYTYKYKITYEYVDDNNNMTSTGVYVSDKVIVSKDGKILNDKRNLGGYNDVNLGFTGFFNYKTRKLNIVVNEGYTFDKVGKVNLYVEMENYLGKKLEKTLVNTLGPIEVFPSPIIDFNNKKTRIEFDYNPSDINYYTGTTINGKIYLYDILGNNYYDQGLGSNYNGLDIKHEDGDKIEFFDWNIKDYVKGQKNNLSHELYKDASTGEYYYSIKFRFNEVGYYKKGFYISGVHMNSGKNTKDSFKTIPKDYSKQSSFNIKSTNGVNSFPLSCTNSKITLIAKCSRDDIFDSNLSNYRISGCNDSKNTSISFDDEKDNGKEGTLSVTDNAYNTTVEPYAINHIDTTPPEVTISGFPNEPQILANNQKITINIDETKKPKGCRNSETRFELYINGKLDENNTKVFSRDEYIFDIEGLFKTVGNKTLVFKVIDGVGNEKIITKVIKIHPNKIDFNLSSIKFDDSFASRDSIYADNSGSYRYIIDLKDEFGNPITDKTFINVNQDCSNSVDFCHTLTNDEVNNMGNDAISESFGKTDDFGKSYIYLKAKSPGKYTDRFYLKMNKWGNYYENKKGIFQEGYLSIKNFGEYKTNNFKSIFVGKFKILSNDGLTWDGMPDYGVAQKYKLELINNSGKNISFSKGKVLINKNSIINENPSHFWASFSEIKSFFGSDNNKYLGFIGIIDKNNNILDKPVIVSNNLIIEYFFEGSLIRHYLYSNNIKGLDSQIRIGNLGKVDNLGLRVIGYLQGSGKSEVTGQVRNFSDISKSNVRLNIKKNAYKLIKGIAPNTNDVVNDILYIKGKDIKYSEIKNKLLPKQTLFIEDGSFIIDENINKIIGVMVMNDGYNVINDYKTGSKGNIYIGDNVTYINAIFYADGGIISSDGIGNIYNASSLLRSKKLDKQLIIKGSIFTRNTIGGALFGGSFYDLPGGKKLKASPENFNHAMLYDLNHLRKNNKGWDKNPGNTYNQGFKENIIIIYDSSIQTNPPVGF